MNSNSKWNNRWNNRWKNKWNNKLKKIVAIVTLFAFFSLSAFGADSNTPEPMDSSALPQSLKDFRRFEIITLGALPFVMMDTTLAYSAIKTASGAVNANGEPYSITPFATNSCFTWKEDQSKIIGIAIGVCVGIGVTDLIVRLVKRSSAKRKSMQNPGGNISITPLSKDPNATRIKKPESSPESGSGAKNSNASGGIDSDADFDSDDAFNFPSDSLFSFDSNFEFDGD